MTDTKAEITITQDGIVGITLLVSPGLHGLRGLLDGVQRSVWAVEALDAAIRCRSARVNEAEVAHE